MPVVIRLTPVYHSEWGWYVTVYTSDTEHPPYSTTAYLADRRAAFADARQWCHSNYPGVDAVIG